MMVQPYQFHEGMKRWFWWCHLYANWVDRQCCVECDENAGETRGQYRQCPYRGQRGRPPEGHTVNLWQGR